MVPTLINTFVLADLAPADLVPINRSWDCCVENAEYTNDGIKGIDNINEDANCSQESTDNWGMFNETILIFIINIYTSVLKIFLYCAGEMIVAIRQS
ncbi:13339_t:CDS:2 [Gigaspora margarita]|uniref:13339_t:CDS:1 n=1 Tax=Gigaspora margarita TaxID=4874 RepID=A0ABN7UHV5_GIGMA|nr:13339_t:CDS:2 [Gigaspora margarita]